MKSRRALLYVPGNDEHKIAKAAALVVDGVILDLEDGVAANRKDEARSTIQKALTELDFGNNERLVRINPVQGGRAEEDLQFVLAGRPDTILLPKADSPEIVNYVDGLLSEFEEKNGWEPGSIALIAIIESAKAFINLQTICQSCARLQGLVFGAEDLTADMGMTRTPAALELLYARSSLAIYAAAFGLQAIDMVQTNYTDDYLLEQESRQGAEMGYAGKQVIHPAQIKIVQRAYTPSPESISKALRIVEAAHIHSEIGKGAFTLDGEMVDQPVIKRAETVLVRARAAGILPEK